MHIKADEGTAGHDIYKLCPLQNGERLSFMQRLGEIQLPVLPYLNRMLFQMVSGIDLPVETENRRILLAA